MCSNYLFGIIPALSSLPFLLVMRYLIVQALGLFERQGLPLIVPHLENELLGLLCLICNEESLLLTMVFCSMSPTTQDLAL